MDRWARCMGGGAVKAVVAIPKLVYDIVMAERPAHQPFVDRDDQFETCFNDRACRRELARHTLGYLDKSDAEIDSQLADVPIQALRIAIEGDRLPLMQECAERYLRVRLEVNARNGLSQYQAEKARYDEMTAKQPTCSAIMQLQPPVEPKPPMSQKECIITSKTPTTSA